MINILFELKKIQVCRWIITVLAALLLLNILLFTVQYNNSSEYYDSKTDELIKLYETDYLQFESNLKYLQAENKNENACADELTKYYYVLQLAEKNSNFLRIAEKTVAAAKEEMTNSELESYGPGSFRYDFQNMIYTEYSNAASHVVIPVELTYGWSVVFDYSFDNWLMLIVLFLIIGYVFINEKETGMLPIMRTTACGRGKTGVEKCVAVILAAVAVFIMFSLSEIAAAWCSGGLSSCNSPIQSISEFENCPYTFSVIEYYLIKQLIRLVVFLALSSVLMIVVSATMNSAIYFVYFAAIIGLNYWLNIKDYSSINAVLRHLNLMSVLSTNDFFKRYYAANIGGKLVDFKILFFISFALIIVAGSMLTVFLWKHRVFTFRKKLNRRVFTKIYVFICGKAFTGKIKNKKHNIGLIGYEIYKIMSSGILLLLIVALAIFQPYLSVSDIVKKQDSSEAAYREYMGILEGPISDEKRVYIGNEYERINKALKMLDSYDIENLTEEEQNAVTAEINYAYAHKTAIGRVVDYLNYVSNFGDGAYFIYDTPWIMFFERSENYIPVILIIILAVYLFSVDSDKNSNIDMAQILHITPKGGWQTYISKIIAIVMISASVGVFCELSDYLTVALRYEFSDGGISVGMLQLWSKSEALKLSECPSIRVSAISCLTLRISEVIIAALMTAVVTTLIKKKSASTVFAAAVILLPSLWNGEYFSGRIFDIMSLSRYVETVNGFLTDSCNYPFVKIISVGALSFLIALICVIIAFFLTYIGKEIIYSIKNKYRKTGALST